MAAVTSGLFTAVHEAGHAVCALLHGVPVRSVGLTPDDPAGLGLCRLDWRGSDPVAFATAIAAGPAAERRVRPAAGPDPGDEAKLALIRAELAARGRPLPDVHRAAERFVADPLHWSLIEGLAAELVARGAMAGPAVADWITAAVRRMAARAGPGR